MQALLWSGASTEEATLLIALLTQELPHSLPDPGLDRSGGKVLSATVT